LNAPGSLFPELCVENSATASSDASGSCRRHERVAPPGQWRRVPADYFSVLNCDEAHHAAARTLSELPDYSAKVRFTAKSA